MNNNKHFEKLIFAPFSGPVFSKIYYQESISSFLD